MDNHADLVAPCPPDELFGWVDDLARYPSWLDIVTAARPEVAAGDDAVWEIELRARLGPLARSKRLRMNRTVHDAPHRVRFERTEHDGRSHSPWVLEAEVAPHPDGSALHMRLHYGGSLFGPVLAPYDPLATAPSRALQPPSSVNTAR